MADIQLSRPAANQTQTVASASDARFVLNFAAGDAKLAKSDNGENLILTFDDGAKIEIEGFYTTFDKDSLPTLNVGGQDITGEQLAVVLGEDLMPAAGPSAGQAAAQGGRFRTFADADLSGGLDRLNGLDIGFDGAAAQADAPEGYYALTAEVIVASDTEPASASALASATTSAQAPVPESTFASSPAPVTPFPQTPEEPLPEGYAFKLHDTNSVHAGEHYDANRGNIGAAGGNVGEGADALTPLIIRSSEGVQDISIGGVLVVQAGALVTTQVDTGKGILTVTEYGPWTDGKTGSADGYRLTYDFTPAVAPAEVALAVQITDRLGRSIIGDLMLKSVTPQPSYMETSVLDDTGTSILVAPDVGPDEDVASGELAASAGGGAPTITEDIGYVLGGKGQSLGMGTSKATATTSDSGIGSLAVDHYLGWKEQSFGIDTSTATANTPVEVGNNTAVVGGDYSVAIGTGVQVNGSHSTGIGKNNVVLGNYSVAVGTNVAVKADHTTALGNVVLEGNNGDNQIAISNKAAVVIGNSRISEGGGNDVITAKAANVSLSSSVIDGGDGADTIQFRADDSFTSTDSKILGGVGNDSMEIGLGGKEALLEGSVVSGGDDNDYINIGRGYGTSSTDHTILTHTAVYGDAGNDTIEIGGGHGYATTLTNVSVSGGAGKDSMEIGLGGKEARLENTAVSGGDDNDYINIGRGGGASSTDHTILTHTAVYGDAGNDTIEIGGGHGYTTTLTNVSVSGGVGNDSMEIGLGGKEARLENTAVSGGDDNDYINIGRGYGASSTDHTILTHTAVYGDAGNDTIEIGGGHGYATTLTKASIFGGIGEDSIHITGETLAVRAASVDGGADNDRIFIEGGTATSDSITVNGGEGNDTLYVHGVVDNSLIEGGDGVDSISVNGTFNGTTVDGGAGNDTLYVRGTLENVTVDGGYGNDAITVGGSLANVTVDGGVGNDNIYISGSTQGVDIFGGVGNDMLNASGTNDGVRLFGGTGEDVLKGGTGNDYLHGGAGEDKISGGAGNDIIVYDIVDSKLDGGEGIDFVLASDSDLTMDKLLNGWQGGPLDGPHAENVEVLIKGGDALKLTSVEQMASQYGIKVDGDKLKLDTSKWTEQADGSYTFKDGADLTLEVNGNSMVAEASSELSQAVFALTTGHGG